MFRWKKRILAVVAAVVLPVLAALWGAVLSRLNAAQHPRLPFVYVGAIVLLSATVAFYTHIRPPRDLEKPILKMLGILAEGTLKIATHAGIKPRINLMILTKPWHFFGRGRIEVVWGVGMDSFPDVRFSCREDQGVAGKALRSGLPVMFDCQTQDIQSLGLSQRQIDRTTHVKAIWSWPIYEVDAQGQQTGRLIGILNLDSTAEEGFSRLQQSSIALEPELIRLRDTIAQTL